MHHSGAFLVMLFCAASAQADNWPNWRGPNGNGVVTDGHEYPTEWSSKAGVRWKFKLPAHAGSTPIVWDDRIFLTSPRDGQNVAICIDRDGKLVWETALGDDRPGKHKKASGSNPSPVTDGSLLFAYFKSGALAALDLDGRVVWQTNLQDRFGKDTLWWDLGTSPVLTEDHVVVACIQSDSSYVVAFDKQSGEVAWKVERNLDAPVESNQSYSTPVVVTDKDDRQIIIVLGADHVTGQDAKNGKELWRVGGLNPDGEMYFRSIASAVVSNGVVLAPYARGDTLTAIRLGKSGDLTGTSHVLWTQRGAFSDVPTPVADDGRAYVCGDKGTISCIEIESGDTIWSVNLKRNRNQYSSSPILANDRLYVTREDGVTTVLNSTTGATISTSELDGEFTVASPVLVDGEILLRTADHLYSIIGTSRDTPRSRE